MRFFKGKIGRKQYWVRTLSFMGVGVAFFALPIILEALITDPTTIRYSLELVSGITFLIGVLFFITAPIITAPPRLRDLGHSGWMALIGFIPVVGILCIPGLLIYCGFFLSKQKIENEILEEGQ